MAIPATDYAVTEYLHQYALAGKVPARDLAIHIMCGRMTWFGDGMKILGSSNVYGVIPLDVVLLLGF
jgi:hypothetical protein